MKIIGRRRLHLLYTDIEDMPLSRIIHIWGYFATIGIVGYGVLWVAGKFI